MNTVDAWLQETIPASKRLTRPILVLCRTNATLNTVRGWAARQRGLPGFEVATPRMLAAQLEGAQLADTPAIDDDLPDHPFADRMRTRPGLVSLARQRVLEARRTLAASPSTPLPQWLRDLAESTWAREGDTEIQLLELARQNGPTLTASLTWAKVIPVGFDTPNEPWLNAIVEALTGCPPTLPEEGCAPERAIRVPDPVAEAREAARLAAASPEDTLVLVQHPATAARVHRALVRNGVPSAWRGSLRLQRHTLATVIRRCVPWFGGAEDPSIRATDLHEVLRHPLLAQRLPPPADSWLRARLEALGDDPDSTWLSPRELTRAIKRARHLDAPLSRWLAELEALQSRTDEDGVPARSARLQARLGVLQAAVQGRTYQEVFDNDAPEEEDDWGEFDELVTRLLGDQNPSLPPPIEPAGTLGALRRFLLATQVRTKDDPAALRILGALRAASTRPATRLEALQCLHGVVERAECRSGVEIIAYDDYDGRPTGQLVLCDVHDQGVAARPRPDPLLRDAQLRAMGQLDGRARVRFRLGQLKLATVRSKSAIALVSQHDTMGRVVVPPVQLRLQFIDHDSSPYGLDTDLPETRSVQALRVAEPSPTPPGDDLLSRMAVQVTAEWYRAGRGPIGTPPRAKRVPGSKTLAHLLAMRPEPPVWLAPYLGRLPDTPEARLAEGERSVTRFFQPLSHCLYQAFSKNVLRVDEPEVLSDELDARQVGNAVHQALEHAAPAGGWGHAGEQAPVVERFLAQLRTQNESAFADARSEFGALSPAREAATRGLEQRWATHWAAWAESRTAPAAGGDDSEPYDMLLKRHVHLDRAKAAFEQLASAADLPTLNSWAVTDWLLWIVCRNLDDQSMKSDELLRSFDRNGLPGAYESLARQFLSHPSLRALAQTVAEVQLLRHAMSQPTFGVVAEVPFGEGTGAATLHVGDQTFSVELGAISLDLGGRTVATRGYIDRILLVGRSDHPLLRLTDYKSGGVVPNAWHGLRRLLELEDPQLVVYALVLRQALRDGRLPAPFANAVVATVGWDHLRATRLQREKLTLVPPSDKFLLDDATLDLLARALGSLVERARSGDWPLSPRADTCPKLKRWGHDHCPYADACRFRTLPEGTP